MSLIPKKVFFVKGKGFHKVKLASFEQALKDAGIEKYNLVKVSSIGNSLGTGSISLKHDVKTKDTNPTNNNFFIVICF